MIFIIIFWFCVLLIVHSYVVYPFLLELLARNKKENQLVFRQNDHLPFISILMSVHNEESVLTKKIRSIYNTIYPINRFEVLIGSDASTDGTDRICRVYDNNYQNFHYYPFNIRQGKPGIINKLTEQAKGNILVLTDAKVFLSSSTLFELITHFRNPDIHIVGGNILNEKISKDGISQQEKAFMSREITMKYQEGLIWGKTIGIYGAIYAIRKTSYTPVPGSFAVDDFFITMNALVNRQKAIINKNALTREEVPNEIRAEFKRKVRISAGNFQNLAYFLHALWPPFSGLSFAFFSHKVIRWFGPFLILLAYAMLILLSFASIFYSILFFIMTFFFLIPLIDIFLRKLKIHVVFLRFITHFFAMNLALLIGFFKFIFGIKTNVWQPTRR